MYTYYNIFYIYNNENKLLVLNDKREARFEVRTYKYTERFWKKNKTGKEKSVQLFFQPFFFLYNIKNKEKKIEFSYYFYVQYFNKIEKITRRTIYTDIESNWRTIGQDSESFN